VRIVSRGVGMTCHSAIWRKEAVALQLVICPAWVSSNRIS